MAVYSFSFNEEKSIQIVKLNELDETSIFKIKTTFSLCNRSLLLLFRTITFKGNEREIRTDTISVRVPITFDVKLSNILNDSNTLLHENYVCLKIAEHIK